MIRGHDLPHPASSLLDWVRPEHITFTMLLLPDKQQTVFQSNWDNVEDKLCFLF